MAAIRTEFGGWLHSGAAFGTMLGRIDFCAAFGTELDVSRQRRFAVGAGGPDICTPLFQIQFLVFLSHGRVSPDFFPRPAGLSGRHFDAQVRRAFLAKSLFGIPAIFPANPA